MSLSSPSVPTVPNPQTTAEQQQQINTSTLENNQSANQVNQVTPTGSLTYTQTGVGPNGVPTYTATQTLSPAEQALLTQMQGTQGILGGQAASLLSQANYGGGGSPATGSSVPNPPVMSTGSGSNPSTSSLGATNPSTSTTGETPGQIIGNSTSGETQALLGQETSYLSPYFTQQTQQLDTQLRSQGIEPGSEAYNNSMLNLSKQQNNAVTGFLATAEPAAYQQATTSYELPMTMALQELQASQPSGVGLTSTPQESMSPANLEGDVATSDQANMAAYNAQLQQQNAMMSGLFGLGAASISGGTGGFGNSLAGTLLTGSDIKIKKNVQRVGTLFDGTPIYRFQYIGSEQWQIGVMAQDVEKTTPDAIREIDGVKYVDYRLATERSANHG